MERLKRRLSVHASAFRGSAGRMELVLTAAAVWKICATLLPSRDTLYRADTPSTRWRVPTSSSRCRQNSMTCMRLLFCARESSAFAACASLAWSRASAWDCLASALQLISPLRCSWLGSVRSMFPRAEILTGNSRNLWARPGWEVRLKNRQWNFDRAVTFAPSGDVVVAALSSLRKGGVVAINAIHLDRMPQFDYDKLLWGERQIRSVANMTRDDARDFLALAAQIGLKPKVTVFSLGHANEALIAVKNDAVDGAAVIVP